MKKIGLIVALFVFIYGVGVFVLTEKADAVSASKYSITIIAKTKNIVKDKNGDTLKTVKVGQTFTLKNLSNKKGVVVVNKKEGFIDLTKYRHLNAVDGTKSMSYAHYTYILKVFSYMYPTKVKLQKIGTSVDGRAIYGFRLGTGKKEIYIDASTHAREHMTTNVVMEMIDTYTRAYDKGQNLYGYNVEKTLNKTSIWFVPMVNPDGVMLVQQGLKSVSKKYRSVALKANGGSTNFARYKANIRGVDINRNYNVGWSSVSKAINRPYYQFYKGKKAVSEPETAALVKFVKAHSFKTYLTYHSSGQVLYWYYNQSSKQKAIDYKVMNQIRNVTGYRAMSSTGVSSGSGAGQDWFVAAMKKPGITIEIAPAVGQRTVPHRYWSSVWQKNKTVGLLAAKEAASR